MMMFTLYGFDMRNQKNKITHTTLARNASDAKLKYAKLYPFFVPVATFPNVE